MAVVGAGGGDYAYAAASDGGGNHRRSISLWLGVAEFAEEPGAL